MTEPAGHTEPAQRAVGSAAPALHAAAQLAGTYRAASQLCVLHEGQVVLDQAHGCDPDALFLLFSAGKPFVAVLVHLLAERGQLDLDAPVARYWPQFARHGKQAVTVRQVLAHRSGIPVAHSVIADAWRATSWEHSIAALERARPRTRAGQVAAYHLLSYGFLLGELVQRVTGADLRDVLRTELLDPLGMHDTHIGLPAALWRRHVPVFAPVLSLGGAQRAALFNSRRWRHAVIPAATISSTARDLSRFYQMLLDGGSCASGQLLQPQTVAAACRPSTRDGETDRFLRLPIRWSHGFQLGGGASPGRRPNPMGRTSSPQAFGHNGSNACLGWADPSRALVMVYLTNRLQAGLEASPHLADVSDAVLATYPAAPST